jgi:ligand-binding SRPBCC domain-containing protein
MYRLDRKQFVPRPRSEVFAFFSDPANLARITPPDLSFRLVGHESPTATRTAAPRVEEGGRSTEGESAHRDGPVERHPAGAGVVMQAGLRIHYRVRPLGFPQRWTSLITEWRPPDRFVDEQLYGPYRSWRHVHEFVDTDGGTEVRDAVEYALPFGPLGRLAHLLLVHRKLETIFDYRHRVIEEIFGKPLRV